MEPATQAVPGYFVWSVPGKRVAIQLRVDAVDRMVPDIMRGFGAVPKRGAEVGGILIGTIQSGNVRIEDFEPIPCSYSRGPSYLLTESEKATFDDVCRRRSKEIVGYYRSHTREGLTLQQEDLELLDRTFTSPDQVALLVRPFATKPGVAGFFVRENGVFPGATPLEFPFRRWEMTGEEPPRRVPMQERKRKDKDAGESASPAEGGPAAPARYERIFSMEPMEPTGATVDQEKSKGSKSRTGMWLVAAFVFLLLGVLLGYQASRITAPRRASDFALSLAAERTGENLTVRWNPDSLAVRSASRGMLEIDMGGETQRVELDRSNLSNGSMLYGNAADKVRFRLVVYLATGLSVTEEVEWPR